MKPTPDLKEKSRKLIFDSGLRQFPTIFELYVKAFNIEGLDLDIAMARIVEIIRTSENVEVAHTMVCHYLDSLEEDRP
jgi:hypothetical protein